MRKRVCCALSFFLMIGISLKASAAEYIRYGITIKTIHPLSKDRIKDSGLANYTRFYFPTATWGDSSCRPDAADLHKDDAHVLSILLAAWAQGKKLDIIVEDSLPKAQSNVCRMVGAFVKS